MQQSSSESSAVPSTSEQSLLQCILPDLGKLSISKKAYQPKVYSLTTLPLDVILLIADHLPVVERTMLWLTCKTFHESIPMKGYHPIACPFARIRTLRLLYDSPLLPYFGHNSKFLCRMRSRRNVRKAVGKIQKCDCCKFFSKLGKNVQCPFHPPIDKGPHSTPLFRSLNHDKRAMRERTNSSTLTVESYVKGCLPSLKSKFKPIISTCQNAGLPSSWDEELCDLEKVCLSRIRECKRALGMAESRFHEPTKWWDQHWRTHFADMNICTLVTCNHCMNAFPSNSQTVGSACIFCGCSACGWSEPKLLRISDGGCPQFLILGQIAPSPR
ncbi:hypothetical protein MGYG_05355 [Nannizzia gypsea CBS 118893]|uniref:F-box domain-containing protein n=1 Tax=Arthroderma gypseum (strain ATCC MYA-4604 / CBS 118893) TaxID=535722 RepID=E4UVN1_ARTGP|nr:hypothetical protein MGYG_05355 [Nannizzia gypsea CBS 118893]EFR02358.1 hypothetical protein MGYG_05355 [Nannizzia gypsea CBS 118893]